MVDLGTSVADGGRPRLSVESSNPSGSYRGKVYKTRYGSGSSGQILDPFVDEPLRDQFYQYFGLCVPVLGPNERDEVDLGRDRDVQYGPRVTVRLGLVSGWDCACPETLPFRVSIRETGPVWSRSVVNFLDYPILVFAQTCPETKHLSTYGLRVFQRTSTRPVPL